MECVVGWVDGEGGRCRPRRRVSNPSLRWHEATLRPAGVVVFATLEKPDQRKRAQEPTSQLPTHDWRCRARRSMAWLLER
jgi:hypothetical protein